MKRYIYILIGIIIIAVVAILVLFLWRNSHPAGTTNATGRTGSLPNAGTQSNSSSSGSANEGGDVGSTGSTGTTTTTLVSGGATSFGIVDNDPILNYFVDAQNNIIAVKTDGTIEEVTKGQTTVLSPTSTVSIVSANFSYDGKKILMLSGDPNDPGASVFDIASRAWTALPKGLIGAEWSPSSYQIAYLASGKTGTVLATFDISNPKKLPVALTTISAQDLALRWLTNTQIVLADKPSTSVGTSLLLWNAKTAALTPIVFEASGLQAIWTGSTGSTQPLGLVFAGSAGGYSLQLDTLAGNPLQTLSFVTLPSKCIFNVEGGLATAPSSTAVLYCGIPRDQASLSAAHLPDDYDQMALFTSDDVYKINVVTGTTTVLWSDQNQNVDVSDMKFANGNVFFINRYDQKLYALTLAANS